MHAATRVARAPFGGSRVLLGVTGGIAAYKAIHLARELTLAGSAVDVVLTTSALEFVRPLTFEALTGRGVSHEMYAPGDPLLHIRLAREADLVIVAPATANFVARAAAGMGDDLLATVLLATTAPVLVCPAMNDRMYAHPQTRANVNRLREIGYHLVGPDAGALAWGEGEGVGRMVEPEIILQHAGRYLDKPALGGRRVLVTAGPTREPIDPVRFIGNRSSGRMGFAVAEAAWRRGADVVLIAGPTPLATPVGVSRIDVETAAEMHAAVAAELARADVLVMAAAVADFRPASSASQKIKKEGAVVSTLTLEATCDVLLSTRGQRRPDAIVVGFALETEAPLENGRRKLEGKALDLLVVNDATEAGAGFEVETNRVAFLSPGGEVEELPLLSKAAVADRILDRVAALLDGRAP